MPRFVLLYHACPPNYERPSHWDLMLEVGDALHTWALQELPHDWRAAQRATMAIDSSCPPVATGDAVDAQQLGHHRKSYLEYEGPLSGDRGQVHRIDSGNYFGEQTVTEDLADWHWKAAQFAAASFCNKNPTTSKIGFFAARSVQVRVADPDGRDPPAIYYCDGPCAIPLAHHPRRDAAPLPVPIAHPLALTAIRIRRALRRSNRRLRSE